MGTQPGSNPQTGKLRNLYTPPSHFCVTLWWKAVVEERAKPTINQQGLPPRNSTTQHNSHRWKYARWYSLAHRPVPPLPHLPHLPSTTANNNNITKIVVYNIIHNTARGKQWWKESTTSRAENHHHHHNQQLRKTNAMDSMGHHDWFGAARCRSHCCD